MGFSHLRATRPETTPAPAGERAFPVVAVEARYVDVRPPIVEFGAVVAGSVVELRPLVAGRIAGLGDPTSSRARLNRVRR